MQEINFLEILCSVVISELMPILKFNCQISRPYVIDEHVKYVHRQESKSRALFPLINASIRR